MQENTNGVLWLFVYVCAP